MRVLAPRELIPNAQKLGFEVIMSVRCNRCLADGSSIQQVAQRGQVVTLKGLDIPVARVLVLATARGDRGAREALYRGHRGLKWRLPRAPGQATVGH